VINRRSRLAEVLKLKVENIQGRVLTDAEQTALIAACPKKLRCLVMLLLLTGARVGETLALLWEDVSDDGVLTFLHAKTGKIRCVGGTEEIQAVLKALPRTYAHVFASARTGKPYTADGLRSMLRRARDRADIDRRAVSFHALRASCRQPDYAGRGITDTRSRRVWWRPTSTSKPSQRSLATAHRGCYSSVARTNPRRANRRRSR